MLAIAVLANVHQGEGLLCSPLCIRGRVCCVRHCASGGKSAVLAIVHQGEGLLCSPLRIRGRVCCARHCALITGRANFFFGPTFDLENFPTSGVKGRVLLEATPPVGDFYRDPVFSPNPMRPHPLLSCDCYHAPRDFLTATFDPTMRFKRSNSNLENFHGVFGVAAFSLLLTPWRDIS